MGESLQGELQEKIGYHFNNIELLKRALTHNSVGNELDRGRNYVRLEWLGDAILQHIISAYLYTKYPEYNKYQLHSERQELVNNKKLNEILQNWTSTNI